MSKNYTILITGSNGLLGQKLVELLANEPGVVLIASSRGPNRIKSSASFHYVDLDVCDPKALDGVFRQYQPSHVIHTAAMTNVDQCEEMPEACHALNVLAVEQMVKACERYGAYLCHLSTDFIFDGANGPYDEEAPACPISIYGESKWQAEQIIQGGKMNWGIARTILVYGIVQDMSRSNIILWVKNALEQGKKIQVVTDQFRTPTLAEDLAMGCWLMVKQEAQGIFNISGSDLLTPYDMAIKTAAFFGLAQDLIEPADSSNFQQKAKRPAKTGFLLDKAKTKLGYQPHGFEEGIAIVARQVQQAQED